MEFKLTDEIEVRIECEDCGCELKAGQSNNNARDIAVEINEIVVGRCDCAKAEITALEERVETLVDALLEAKEELS